jgi:hypothetical protein
MAVIMAAMPRLIYELAVESGQTVWRLAKIVFPSPDAAVAQAEAEQAHEFAQAVPEPEAAPHAEEQHIGEAVLAALLGEEHERDLGADVWQRLGALEGVELARLASAQTWEIGAYVLGRRSLAGLPSTNDLRKRGDRDGVTRSHKNEAVTPDWHQEDRATPAFAM